MLKDLQKQLEQQLATAKTDLENRIKNALPDFEVVAQLNMDLSSVSLNVTRRDKIVQSVGFSRIKKEGKVLRDFSFLSYQQNYENSISLIVLPTTISMEIINFILNTVEDFVLEHTAEQE